MQLYYDLSEGDFQHVLEVDVTTHRGVIGGDINQDLCGAPAAHISVAVPYTANQVGLSPGRENKEQTMTFNNTVSTFHYCWCCLLWPHPFIKVSDERDISLLDKDQYFSYLSNKTALDICQFDILAHTVYKDIFLDNVAVLGLPPIF